MEELKKAKDAAKKRLMGASQKAAPFTGDRAELEEALKEAEEAGVPDKEIAEAKGKLTDMISFHFMLEQAATELHAVRVCRLLCRRRLCSPSTAVLSHARFFFLRSRQL